MLPAREVDENTSYSQQSAEAAPRLRPGCDIGYPSRYSSSMDQRPGIIDTDHCALFLDVDGTLLEIETNPDAVRADEALRGLLERLYRRLGGAMALVSGRTLDALDRIFAPLELPAAGAHGVELRVTAGGRRMLAPHDLPVTVTAALRDFAGRHEGLLLEPKPGGASLHYRRAPALENECRRFMQSLIDELRADYRLIDGKMVLEIAPVAVNKGEAIRALLHESPFGGRRPVFAGDDTTDEDGFRVVNALGGMSVRVGPVRRSAASHALANTADVRYWLAVLATAKPAANDEERSIAQS